MTQEHYIGRGEILFSQIVKRIFPGVNVRAQVPLANLISKEDYEILDSVYKKHRFDYVLEFDQYEKIAVEINYKHGEILQKKWSNVFLKLLNKYLIRPVTVDDWDCTHFFQMSATKGHIDSWDDWIDVINSFKKADIPTPPFSS